jgi:hypothetical protein
VKAVADALGISRSNLVEQMNSDDGGLPPVPPSPPDDTELLERDRRQLLVPDNDNYSCRSQPR